MRILGARSGVHVAMTLVALLAASCSALGPAPRQQPNAAAPTVAPVFLANSKLAAAAAQAPAQVPAGGAGNAGPLVAPTPDASLPKPPAGGAVAVAARPIQGDAGRPANQAGEVVVYDDALNPDWSTEHSDGVKYALADASHVYSGTVSAAVTPEQNLGMFFLTVRSDARQTYGLDRVFGVSMWINSGSEPLDPSSLSVTVVGSNDYPYWVNDDHSVTIDERHFFSESRLYFLGINRPVPANTWVEVDVWLDKLPYEPVYKYVTGIYIKNDPAFKRTFYVDQVRLLVTK